MNGLLRNFLKSRLKMAIALRITGITGIASRRYRCIVPFSIAAVQALAGEVDEDVLKRGERIEIERMGMEYSSNTARMEGIPGCRSLPR